MFKYNADLFLDEWMRANLKTVLEVEDLFAILTVLKKTAESVYDEHKRINEVRRLNANIISEYSSILQVLLSCFLFVYAKNKNNHMGGYQASIDYFKGAIAEVCRFALFSTEMIKDSDYTEYINHCISLCVNKQINFSSYRSTYDPIYATRKVV